LTILDTDIIVALLKGEPEALEKIRTLEEKGDTLSTTIVTVYELLKGAYLSSKPQENLMKIRDSISTLQVLELTFNACEEASKIHRDLKKTGYMVGEFDILIAAIANTNDETIVTRDEQFELIRGTKLIKW
jgi:predicted nucleic acid-binding protein